MKPVRVQTRHTYHRCLMKVLEYIVLRQSGLIRVPDLAEFAGFSRFHLSRFFYSTMGETLSELVRRIRLERAAYFLQTTSRSVLEIADEAGYSGPESFSRSFRMAYGMPPSEFRQSMPQRPWQLPSVSGVHWTPDLSLQEFSVDPADDFEMSILAMPPMKLAAVRHVGPYLESHYAWEDFRARLPEPLWNRPDTKYLAIYHDNYYTHDDHRMLRCDLAVTIPWDVPAPSWCHTIHIPAGVYAATRKFLSLDERNRAWPRVSIEWVPRRGQKPVNVPAFDLHTEWPIPWESAMTRIFVGLEMDIGEAGNVRPFKEPGLRHLTA